MAATLTTTPERRTARRRPTAPTPPRTTRGLGLNALELEAVLTAVVDRQELAGVDARALLVRAGARLELELAAELAR